jgi:hypothetical protein
VDAGKTQSKSNCFALVERFQNLPTTFFRDRLIDC